MDAVRFLKEFYRMCGKYKDCTGCPVKSIRAEKQLSCYGFQHRFPIQVVNIVEKWSKEHPQKTRLDDFKEKFPNFIQNEIGYPQMLPKSLGYCGAQDCLECDYFIEQVRDIKNSPDCRCWDLPVEDEK